MKILVVEDQDEQVEIAKKKLSALGYKVAVARTLSDARRLMNAMNFDGVITDLHFPESSEPYNIKETADKPNGLAVVADAINRNIPVGVCSDIDHHFCTYVKEVLGLLATHQCYTHRYIPFTEDHKDWSRIGQELMELIRVNQDK